MKYSLVNFSLLSKSFINLIRDSFKDVSKAFAITCKVSSETNVSKSNINSSSSSKCSLTKLSMITLASFLYSVSLFIFCKIIVVYSLIFVLIEAITSSVNKDPFKLYSSKVKSSYFLSIIYLRIALYLSLKLIIISSKVLSIKSLLFNTSMTCLASSYNVA